MANLFDSTGASVFPVQHHGIESILKCKNKYLKFSSLKLYLTLCYRCRPYTPPYSDDTRICKFLPDTGTLEELTGLTSNTIRSARNMLVRLKLVSCKGGSYSVLNPQGHPFDTGCYSPELLRDFPLGTGSGYFQCPTDYLTSGLFKSDSGISTAVYLQLLKDGNRKGTALLPVTSGELVKRSGMSRGAVGKALRILSAGEKPFLSVTPDDIEILHPVTCKTLSPFRPYRDKPLYVDTETGRPKGWSSLLTRENFEKFYLHHLSDLDTGKDQQDVCCPFHDDVTPSMSLNLKEGVWCCHGACGNGGGMVDFQQKLRKRDGKSTDDYAVKRAVAKILHVKLHTKPHRIEEEWPTVRYDYTDADGSVRYQVRRYLDGSARPWRPMDTEGKHWRCGIEGLGRILFNLPQVRAAQTVIIVEGEKKVGRMQTMELEDADGRPVAITTSLCGANQWLPKYEYTKELQGKRVLVLSDADEPGKVYENAVTSSLSRAGIPYKVVSFGELGHKDVRGFLDSFPDYSTGRNALLAFMDSDWMEKPVPAGIAVERGLEGV